MRSVTLQLRLKLVSGSGLSAEDRPMARAVPTPLSDAAREQGRARRASHPAEIPAPPAISERGRSSSDSKEN